MNIQPKPNKTWGPSLPYIKPEGVFCFEHQNVNGIPLSQDGLNFWLAFYKTIKVHCNAFYFAEMNLEWSLLDVAACMKLVATIMFGNIKTMTLTSTQRFAKPWKPGRTLVAIHGYHVKSVIGQDANPLERWSMLRISGKGDSTITVILAYRVDGRLSPVPPQLMHNNKVSYS